jgi:class 3 adenylate cyclase
MPLFMDRHDIRGSTAKDVAQAHHSDLEVQARHFCKALTYWYDEPRGTAFCLVEAPSETAVREMHREAHGLIPNQVIEVDASMVAQFLGRITDPEATEGQPIQDSAFRAILFVDMVSSTDITKAFGDSTALRFVRRYRDIVRRALLDHGGREVDRAGDGFLTSFASVYAAVKCAITIQRELSRDNVGRADGVAVQARIGIGAGEPVQDGDALFGSIVNLTSRICDCGEPGQIISARVVRELCMGKDVTFKSIGPRMLKGFNDSTDLELVEWQEYPSGLP